MGVAGAGKTTVGALLAGELGWPFVDADDLHPAASIEKMRRGEPLTDADRGPWLDGLAALIAGCLARGERAVLACSALRVSYRERLSGGRPEVAFVLLDVAPELLADRLARRRGHFAGPALLASQLATLEREGVVAVAASGPPAEVAAGIRQRLGLQPSEGRCRKGEKKRAPQRFLP